MRTKNTKTGMALAAAAGVMWASSGIFVRSLTAFGMDNVTILTLRGVFASVLLLAPIAARRARAGLLRIKPRDIWLFACVGIVGTLGTNYCLNEAINALSLSFAAVLLSLTPIFVALMASIFLRERMTRRGALCMAGAILGSVLSSGVFDEAAVPISAAGILFGAASGFFNATTSMFSKVLIGRGYHALTVTFYGTLFFTSVLAPFADWGAAAGFFAAERAAGVAHAVAHALLTAVLPFFCLNMALARTKAAIASIMTMGAEACAATLIGALVYEELPSAAAAAGIALAIFSLARLCLPGKIEGTEA